VSNILFRLKGVAIAIVALALSSSLAFGAQPPEAVSFGLENAASHAGKTVPVAGGQSETTGEEEVGEEPAEVEEVEEDEESEEAGDNCLTDPTAMTEEELAAMRHGSIACWAAHQETPDGYDNHGQWVSEWAHAGKGSDAAGEAKAKGQGKANGKGKGKGKGNAE
jgi:hypothetical protein